MRSAYLLAPVAVLAAAPCQAEVYFTLGQVQATMFPNEVLTPRKLELSAEQVSAIEKSSGVRVRDTTVQAFKASGGGWMMLDSVLGKHEFISYAVALDASGAVQQVEILEYRETYGGQVRNPQWRAQFKGKKTGAALKIDDDIQNVSGATLSCVHVTEGIRRLLATYATVLASS